MRPAPAFFVFAAATGAFAPLPTHAADVASATIGVTVQVASRTSLKVSADVLQFDVLPSEQIATASIDFSAGARVASGADVVLTVEAEHAIDGPGGAADVECSISYEGDGQGLQSGTLRSDVPTTAGQWRGSGLRRGRLLFTLRANSAGTYQVPVRFVLSTP